MKYLFLALLFFVPFSADAALMAMTGMETGGTNEFIATNGTFSVQSSLARSGAYALRINPATTATGSVTFADIDAAFEPGVFNPTPNQIWLTFYFRYAVGPVTADEVISRSTDNNGRNICGLTLNSDGKITLRDNAGSGAMGGSIATSTTALSPNIWYRLEYTCETTATGAYEVKINGTTEMSGTANFKESTGNPWRNISWGKSIDLNGNTVDFYYDDIWVDDAAFIGAHAIKPLVPNAPGTDNNFTDTNANSCWTTVCYFHVDEAPVSGTRYVVSTTTNTRQTFEVQNPEIMDITGTINAVSIFERAIEGSAGTSEWQFLTYTSAASTTATQELSGGAERIWNLPTEPAAGAAWTLSTLANLEIGCQEGATSGVRVRCQEMFAFVSYTESAPYAETPTYKVVQNTLTATLGATTDFTSSGFGIPDAAIIIVGNGTSNLGNPINNVVQSIGFYDGVNTRVSAIGALDNNATTVSLRSSNDSYGVVIPADLSDGAAYSVSTTTDGIRLTLDVDAISGQRYATAILFKGVQAHAFHFFPSSTLNAAATSTSIGFTPDIIFMTTIGDTVMDRSGVGVAVLSNGFVTSDLTQGFLGQYIADAAAAEDLGQYVSKTRATGQNTNTLTWALEVINMNTDTFTGITRTAGSGGDVVFALALGGDISLDKGFLDTPVATGIQTTSTSISPGTLLVGLGTANAFDTIMSTSSANGSLYGIADSTGNQSSYNGSSEDAADPTNNNGMSSTTALIDLDTSVAGTLTDFIDGLVTMDSDSFDINFIRTDTVSRKGWWVAFPAPAAPGGGGVVDFFQDIFWFD